MLFETQSRKSSNNAAEAYCDPRADFRIFLVSRSVAVMGLLAFDEGRVENAYSWR